MREILNDIFNFDLPEYSGLNGKTRKEAVETQLKRIQGLGQEVKDIIERAEDTVIISRDINDFLIKTIATIITEQGIKYDSPFLVATFDDEDTILLGDIKVTGSNINKGYGSMLLRELLVLAKERNIKKITGLAERPNDERLVYFYEKHGFRIVEGSVIWEKNKTDFCRTDDI